MKTVATVVGLMLVALVGCDGSAEGTEPNMRGDVDAGGAGGSAGSAGAPGSGGAAAGGRSGSGGALAAAGGALGSSGGAAGSAAGGAGGGATTIYEPCAAYSWSPNGGTTCTMQTSPGVFLNGYKDGHPCGICRNPTRPAGVPDCEGTGAGLCVVSCDECTFQ